MKPELGYFKNKASMVDFSLASRLVAEGVIALLARSKKTCAREAGDVRVVVKSACKGGGSSQGLGFVASVVIRNQTWGYAKVCWRANKITGKIRLYDVSLLTPRIRKFVRFTLVHF
ncbi:MAG: hypothetical protein JNN11_03630 [Candidatus Doudnabacteria bacterium]|nr:hypothetical protein [Candidatus Doudnabacteria bacterium]